MRSSSLTPFHRVLWLQQSEISTQTTCCPKCSLHSPAPSPLPCSCCTERLPRHLLHPHSEISASASGCAAASYKGHTLICVILKFPHICDITRYLPFSVGLISLCMIVSRPRHVAANGIISFFFMAE